MAQSNLSGPLYVGGVPVLPGFLPGVPNNGGQVFFVSQNYGGGSGPLGSATAPCLTIQTALDLCVSGRGDMIVIMDGSYDENPVVTKDYISIIGGAPSGYAKPDIAPSTGKALVLQAAQGLYLRHLRLATEDDDCVYLEGNGCKIFDCVIDGAGTALKAGIRLRGNATDDSYTASEEEIAGCLIRGHATGLVFDTAEDAVGVGSTDNLIHQNQFQGNTLDIATADTGTVSTYSVQNTQIGPGNQFLDKGKATYIDLTTANGGGAGDQSGAIVNNTFASDTITTTKIKMVGTAFTFSGNYYTVGIADGSGLD